MKILKKIDKYILFIVYTLLVIISLIIIVFIVTLITIVGIFESIYEYIIFNPIMMRLVDIIRRIL